jgi:hypothetical protein
VTRLAQDRAAQQDIHDVWEELRKRLRSDRQRGDFVAVHPAPGDSSQVPDEMETRLVIVDPEKPHSRQSNDSAAKNEVNEILNNRGTSPRLYRNTLIFLAPDKARLQDLEQAIRQYLAWDSIVTNKEALNLDPFQSKLASTKKSDANDAVNNRIQETYVWLLIPGQPMSDGPIEWQEVRVHGNDSLAVRASRKLKSEEHLITNFSATRLKMVLDQYIWKDVEHVPLKKLWEYFASYLYLSRLRDSNVLLEAVQEGVRDLNWTNNFAYAEGWDEKAQRYLGLKAGQIGTVIMDGGSLVVKPEAAEHQLDADAKAKAEKQQTTNPYEEPTQEKATMKEEPEKPKKPKRFHGAISLDPLRISRDAGLIADEIVQHLSKLPNAKIELSLEIHAEIPGGADEQVVRTVAENCRTLKFRSHGFEKE